MSPLCKLSAKTSPNQILCKLSAMVEYDKTDGLSVGAVTTKKRQVRVRLPLFVFYNRWIIS